MHTMLRLETDKGVYAVKLLNPAVMKRPEALQNYAAAEHLESVLQANALPIIPAMAFNGKKLQCIGGQYFYVFPWVEGEALAWDAVETEHCAAIGKLLARIHKLETRHSPADIPMSETDWNVYLSKSRSLCPEIASVLADHIMLLYTAQDEYNTALASLPSVSCICNGDMDSKNVLWLHGTPSIIDLECLAYGNPYLDMFRLALSWAGDTICRIDFGLLTAFIAAYRKEYCGFQVNLSALYGIGFGWLDWLEYNVKRALRMECANDEEQTLGISQVHDTIKRIAYYASIKDTLLRHVSEMETCL